MSQRSLARREPERWSGPARPGPVAPRETAEPRVQPAPSSAGPMKAQPATAPPMRRSRQRSCEQSGYSYFGPVADKVVIYAGQFDRFRVISPKPLHQGLDRAIEIENQAAGVGIPYHALEPEKR